MTDETTVVDTSDDLDAFSEEFFQTKVESEPETSGEDDAPAPEETDETPEPEAEEAEEGDDTPEGDEEVDDGDEPDEDSLLRVKGRRKSARERINELTAKAREAERRAEALAIALEEIKAKPVVEKDSTPKEPAPLGDNAPNPDETLESGDPKYPLGEFDPAYIRDLTRFTIEEQNKLFMEKTEKERQEAEFKAAEEQLQTEWADKIAKAEEHLPEFREKAANLEHTFRNIDPAYGKYLASTIMSMEYGPEVLDYLGGDIAEAQRIVAAGPTAATIALGRLEARFALAKERAEQRDEPKGRTTSAPPPPSRTTRGSGGKFAVAPDTDDLDAFAKVFFKK